LHDRSIANDSGRQHGLARVQDFNISDKSHPPGIVFVSGKGLAEAGEFSTHTGVVAPGRRGWMLLFFSGLDSDAGRSTF
jgi:hypothetical protein